MPKADVSNGILFPTSALIQKDKKPLGLGRVFKIGDQPVSAGIQGYYNAINPTGAPNWQLRAELSFLFPEK